MTSKRSTTPLTLLILLAVAVCGDAKATVTTSSLNMTCHSDNFKNVTCNWTVTPRTNPPRVASCEVIDPQDEISNCQKSYSVRSQQPCSNFSASSREYHFTVSYTVTVASLFLERPNGNETVCILFNRFKHTDPLPPYFNVSILPSRGRSKLTVDWSYPRRIKTKYLTLPLVEITNDYRYDNSTEPVPDIDRSQYTLTVPVGFSNVRYCVKLKSTSRSHKVLGPWSKQICTYTPPQKPNVDITDVSHSNEMNADQSLGRNVTVYWNVEMLTAGPYQGLLGFEVKTKQLSSGAERAQNLTLAEEYKHNLVDNGNFSLEIPDLRTNESYDIMLAGYNKVGFSVSQRHPVEAVQVKSGARRYLFIFYVIGTLGVLILLVLFAYSYQRLKNNYDQFPEPIFTTTDRVNLRPRPEPEVFDQLAVAATADEEVAVESKLPQEYVTMVPSGTAKVPLLAQDKEASHQADGYTRMSTDGISYAQIARNSRGNGSTSPYLPANVMQDSLGKGNPLGMLTTSSGGLTIDGYDAQHDISPGQSTPGQGTSGMNPEVDKNAPDANDEFSLPCAATSSYVPFQPKENEVAAYSPAPVMSSALPLDSGYVDNTAITSGTSAGGGKPLGGSKISPDTSPVHAVIDHARTSAGLKSGCHGSSDELESCLLEDEDQNASSHDEITPLVNERDQHQSLLQSPEEYVSRAPVAAVGGNSTPPQLTENCDETLGAGHEMPAFPHSGYVTQAQIVPRLPRNPAEQPRGMQSPYHPHS
ncbi:uncharacterized protein [Diadema setosum]|uniref:uncharacterized protein n=1 Tax=Diadema setosum TaxID=31175 RepID=UPI003B3ABBF1